MMILGPESAKRDAKLEMPICKNWAMIISQLRVFNKM